MVMIFLLELFAGIYGYVLRSSAGDMVSERMKSTIYHYNDPNNTDTIKFWDKIQIDFECCGINSPKDWVDTWNDTLKPNWKKNEYLPYSCCPIPYGTVGDYNCTYTTVKENVHFNKDGCLVKFSNFVQTHALELGVFGLGIAFCQVY